MDGLYRVPPTAAAQAPRDAGIVGDIIGQFADPLAFYRELVQNAIDAGSPQVDVHLVRDADAPTVRAIVRDLGEGMTRDILENQLLVLFRSTKERDDSKIGKFGIGFASVLAPRPEVVVITTARDGRRLVVHLHPDLSYELFDGGPATRTGTSVELVVPLPESFAAWVDASRASLVRWCRHATVPIRLVATEAGAVVADERIDRPLAIADALVEVRATSDDGLTTAVVALAADAAPYAGFFDHGLTLHEDTAPLGRRLAFKIQDARLAHTLSRDNVRRDAAFDRAVEFALRVADDRMPAATAAALRRAAEAGELDRYAALCAAIRAAELRLPRAAWVVPLVEPLPDGRRAIAAEDVPVRALGAHAPSPITAHLAAAGTPVLHLGDGRPLAPLAVLGDGGPVADAHAELTLVTPVAGDAADAALLALTGEVLARAHRLVGALDLVQLDGALAAQLAITGDRDRAVVPADADPDAPWLVDRRTAGKRPFGRLVRRPIHLSVAHPVVAAARARARFDPRPPAGLLARVLLFGAGLLDAARSEAVLGATLVALGVEEPA